MGKNITVVVGKIHVSEWAKDSFETRLTELLSTREKYKRSKKPRKGANEYFWTFSNYSDIIIDDQIVMFAKLVKVREQINEIVFDEDNWEPTKEAQSIQNAIPSNFIIIPKMRTIMFEEVPQKIKLDLFIEMFEVMYGQRYFSEDFSSLWINPVMEKTQIFEKLKKFDKVTKVKLEITPSNPDTGDYKQLDDLLKDANVDHSKIEFINDVEGLEYKKTIVGEAISLAAAGYGSQEITASKDDKIEVIKSKDSIIRWKVLFNDKPKEFMENLTKRYNKFTHKEETK